MIEETNKKVTEFIGCLVALNHTMAELFSTADLTLFTEMNGQIKHMYKLQNDSEDPVFRAVDPACKIIYGNFDMIVSVLRTTENGVIDEGARKALDKFLHNIDGAVVSIASAIGLV